MNDILGKIIAVMLLASAAFNVYIGANIAILGIVMKSMDVNNLATAFPLINIFVSAGLYGVIGLILLVVKSTRSLNILMAILLLVAAGALSYSAYMLYPSVSTIKNAVNESSEMLGMFTNDDKTVKTFNQTMTAISVYPAYASIFGAVAGGLGGILLFARSS